MSAKLTKAQSETLREVAAVSGSCVRTYKPAVALVYLGLAEWVGANPYGGKLVITPAGRAALTPAEDDKAGQSEVGG